MILYVTIAQKIATYQRRGGDIVCGNGDYKIKFNFDEEWATYPTKTARFKWNGRFYDQDFTGDTCDVPVITNTTLCTVGVFVGNPDKPTLRATTEASIPCQKSALCGGAEPGPENNQYYANEAKRYAEAAKVAAASAGTSIWRCNADLKSKTADEAGLIWLDGECIESIEGKTVEVGDFIIDNNGNYSVVKATQPLGVNISADIHSLNGKDGADGTTIWRTTVALKDATQLPSGGWNIELQDIIPIDGKSVKDNDYIFDNFGWYGFVTQTSDTAVELYSIYNLNGKDGTTIWHSTVAIKDRGQHDEYSFTTSQLVPIEGKEVKVDDLVFDDYGWYMRVGEVGYSNGVATSFRGQEVYNLDGADGITPHIGENGNWWIGDTDTGVSAGGAGGVEVVQTTGNSETAVMSQKATTDFVETYVPKVQSRNLMPTNFQNAVITTLAFAPKTTGYQYAASPDFIEVVGGETYTLSWKGGYNACTLWVYEYDADKAYVKYTNASKGAGMANVQSPKSITLQETTAYVRISIDTWLTDTPWQDLVPETFQLERGAEATEYTPPKVIDSKVIDYSAVLEDTVGWDYLRGKTLVACGDSITDAYDLDANDGSYVKSYAQLTAERHKMKFVKNAVSGSTMAYNADGDAPISTNAFSNTRYLNLPEFDYLTIWFGWNDATYSQLGTIEDMDNTTFYGAYKEVLGYLVLNNPTKKIGLVVPYGSSQVEPYAQAVREISKMYGVPCLDLRDYNECSAFWEKTNGNAAIVARRDALTYDTTHPNQVGHEFLSTMYDNFIKRL